MASPPRSGAARYGLALISVAASLGILAVLLSALVRTFFFEPEVDIISRIVYDLVFVIFAGLMIQATRARNELEVTVAERTRAEEKLRRTEAYLTEAQRLTHTGSFASNIGSRTIVHWSLETFRLFGFDPENGVPSFEAVLERIHPDDREWMVESFRTSFQEGIDREAEFRIVLPDGVIRHIHFLTHPTFNASGHLGLNRTTLINRIKKLGISRPVGQGGLIARGSESRVPEAPA